jgi:DNA-directed RNA polymerase subunit RPC12/RpoP
MNGKIHSDYKCSICNSRFKHDENRRGLFCPEHPNEMATGRFRVYFKGKTTKRCKTYIEAERFLVGLRYESDQNKYDPRDYQKGLPLGFGTLTEEYVKLKKSEGVSAKQINHIRNVLGQAERVWGQKNVKSFTRKDIRDFLNGIKGISKKTRFNYKSTLRDFWRQLVEDEIIVADQAPKFPKVPYNLGYRTYTDKETQERIIDEVYRISYHINPKIYLGILLLATYISLRPNDLLRLKESDIENELCRLIVWHPTKQNKENPKPKIVPILEEDMELIASIQSETKGLPHMPFFRHAAGISGVAAESPFGEKYFYKWWIRACDNLGIKGLDLYGGTRHTITTALSAHHSPETIKRATLHTTNKAFERYMQVQDREVLNVYRSAKDLTKTKQAEVINFSKKGGKK